MPDERDKDRGSPAKAGFSLKQSLYGRLATPEETEDKDTVEAAEKEKKKQKGLYFWMYNFTQNHFVKKKKEGYQKPEDEPGPGVKKKKKANELSKNYKEALDFLGWKLDPQVVMAVPRTAAILGLILGVIISAFLFSYLSYTPPVTATCGDGICAQMKGEDTSTCPEDCARDIVNTGLASAGMSPIMMLFILFVPIFLLLGLMTYAQRYILGAANSEKMRALTYVPEIINYMIMQMRLQPNLERAVEFASEHGEGRIAKEFQDLLFSNRIGIYETVEEGLDDLAYKWEPYSEEFKHAITMIRSSVLVPSDIERNMIYDKVVEDLLDSTREKMELYAHAMQQPSMYLFYIAVLMPLMIIIMLPVAAAFAGLPVASAPILIALYVFILPMITILYAKNVLTKRPGGYIPPEIPDNHPELPKRGTMKTPGGLKLAVMPTAIMIMIAIIIVGVFLDNSIKISEEKLQDMKDLNPNKSIKQPTILQYVIPLAFAIPVGFYLYGISLNKRQVQEKVLKMELDFKDAMYLMASRLGEKKPLEDAMSYVKRFMPESKVATELLDNVERNVMVLGLTLRSAIFDPTYGAMRYIPSRLMASAFKIMTDSIELGPEVASVALISVSNQIRNVQKINELMRKLLDETTGMMESMARFIAPVVLGIVASLQQVIIAVIAPLTGSTGATSNVGSKMGTGAVEAGKSSLGGISTSAMQSMASPFEFQLIIAIYIIELVIILSYFAGKVKYGDNRTAILMTIGKTLPVATAIFVVALYMGANMIGGLAG